MLILDKGDYIPGAPVNDEVRRRNGSLPGMGGVYNTVNLHLCHYAGNNPVKYVDPDWRVDFDVEGRTLNCNLNDASDMRAAADIFFGYSSDYERVVAKDGNGNQIQFNNPNTMYSFLKDNSGEIDLSSLESVVSIGGTAISLAYLAQNAGNGASIAKGLGNIATGLNAVAFAIDFSQFTQNPNLDTASDLVFTAIGFAGPKGTALSLGLTYSKAGLLEGAKALTNFSLNYEKYYINRWSQLLFGVNIK
jgi:hypothetical protein